MLGPMTLQESLARGIEKTNGTRQEESGNGIPRAATESVVIIETSDYSGVKLRIMIETIKKVYDMSYHY
jgi:DNA helicase TIP49 (TBP-interacting protein)